MVRVRTIILCVILALFSYDVVSSHSSASRKKPQRKKSSRSTARVHKPKPPDPALLWNDCGEECLSRIFGNAVSPIRIAPVNGEIGGMAVQGDHVYVLVKNFNLIIDAVFKIRKKNGRIEAIWGLGRHNAEAITSNGARLLIASRSKNYFLRSLSFAGRNGPDITMRSLPEGAISGLASSGDTVYLSTVTGEGSAIYRMSTAGGKPERIGTFSGTVRGLAICGGTLAVLVEEFDRYTDGWIMLLDPAGRVKERLACPGGVPAAITGEGSLLHFLENRKPGSLVYPAVVMSGKRMVLADPRVQRVTITFPVAGMNRHAYHADLWIPYPIHRPFQNVRRVSIEPHTKEVVTDRYGNRWARLNWTGARGRVVARLTFDIITAASAVTVDRDYRFREGDVPPEVHAVTKDETHACDISSYIIRSHATRIEEGGTYLDRILAVRNYVNEAVRFSAYVDRWGRASEYLFRGRGDAYGMALGFAALSRYLGMPSRVAGALRLHGGRAGDDSHSSDVWNQVYLPGQGWIDVGIGRGNGGPRERFAGRPNRYFVTFEGDFDKRDYAGVFAETEWSGVCRWRSADANRRAEVTFGPVSLEVRDLRE